MLGVSPARVGSARETPTAPVVDYYKKLGVPTIINAAGTYTYLTASLMPPEVQAAVAFAAHHSVRLRDLQNAAGAYIAQRLKCEARWSRAGRRPRSRSAPPVA
jgi:L-seryl-tRNA(Ser) seleniumtransferase